jgi:hypothetical protein
MCEDLCQLLYIERWEGPGSNDQSGMGTLAVGDTPYGIFRHNAKGSWKTTTNTEKQVLIFIVIRGDHDLAVRQHQSELKNMIESGSVGHLQNAGRRGL